MAVRFDAESDGYQGAAVAGSTFTFLCWAYYSVNRGVFSTIIDYSTSQSNFMQFSTDTGTQLGIHHQSGGVNVGSLTVGQWHRVAVTCDGTTMTCYLGGPTGALASASTPMPAGFSANTLRVGKSVWPGEWFNGRIAGFKGWDVALTAAQVEAELSQYQPLTRLDQLIRRYNWFTAELVDYSGRGNTLTAGTTTPTTEDGPPIRYARSRGPRVKLSAAPALTPDGVPSAEAVGTPMVTAGSVGVSPGGVPSGEAVGGPALAMSVAPGGVPSAEAVGLPTVVVSGVIAPPGVASAESVGAPALTTGAVAVTAQGVPTAETVGAPRLQLTVSPAGVPGADQVGAPAVVVGAVAVSSGGVPSAEAVGIAVVAAGPVQLDATGVPSAEAIGAPLVVHVAYAVGVPSAEAVGAPLLTVGQVTIYPVGLDSDELVGAPTVLVTLDTSVRVIAGGGRRTPTYEAWIMARIPQQSGPPLLVDVDPIDWTALSWGSTLSQPQTGSVTCRIPTITEIVAQRLRDPELLPSELWIYRNGVLVFAGPLLGGEEGDDELTLTAGGLLTYTYGMYVLGGDDPNEPVKRFDQVDQHDIARWLVDQWQSSEYGHFGIDTSQVTPSGKLRDITYDRAEIHQVSRRIQELGARAGGFDAEVDPTTRALLLHSPEKGADRSTGEDAVVFDGPSIEGGRSGFSVSPGDLASDAFGSGSSATGGAALWSESSNLDLRRSFGRWGVTGSWSDVSEQATLDDHVLALRDSRDQPLRVPPKRIRVTADADLDQWDVGDTVSYELSRLLRIGGAYRVRSRTVDVDAETGEESVTVEFV